MNINFRKMKEGEGGEIWISEGNGAKDVQVKI